MKTNKEDQHSELPEENFREGERDLGPHDNMRPDRFPNSSMTKDQRKDADTASEKDDADIESLAAGVNTVGSRATSSSAADIAGVSDIDRGLSRSKRKR